MLQHAEDVEGNETFDVNAPELGSFVPAIDPEAVPTMSLAPPKDGPNWVIIRARADGKNGPCYKKGEKDRSGKIVKAYLVGHLTVRIWDEENQRETSFLRDWYPTTLTMQGQTSSQLSAICYLAGSPTRYGADLDEIQEHFLRLLEEAGEEGIKLLVRTRWKVAIPKVDQDGMPVFVEGKFDRNGNALKAYNEFASEKKIKKMQTLQAKSDVLTWERDEDETVEEFETRKQDWIDTSDERAHLFSDPVSGEQIVASSEVAEILDHTKLPRNQK